MNNVQSKDITSRFMNTTQPTRNDESSTTRPNLKIIPADAKKTNGTVYVDEIDPKSGVLEEDETVH